VYNLPNAKNKIRASFAACFAGDFGFSVVIVSSLDVLLKMDWWLIAATDDVQEMAFWFQNTSSAILHPTLRLLAYL